MGWTMAGCLTVAALLLTCAAHGASAAPPTIWPAPDGEAIFADYTLTLNGRPAPVHECRVSAVPLNQVWPGYQRPIDQTETAGFATWDQSGPVTVQITAAKPFATVVVRPLSRGIRLKASGRQVRFTLARPGQFTVEFDGPHRTLHLFANPPEAPAPSPESPGVRYFGPGVHHPGKIALRSGETLYLAGGAVVHTAVEAREATGVRILGRGIIDTSEYERDKGGGSIRLMDCKDVKIEGVILRDPDVWCLSAFGCRDMDIANVKLVGLWRYNADGIDICNSQNVTLRGSFVRAFDDAVVLKGLNWGKGGYHERPVSGIRVEDMVLWCDWGRALEIGAETSAPEFTDIVFRNCDVIRTTHIAMDIQCGDRAVVHGVRYEDIRVETDEVCPAPKMQAARDEKYQTNPKDPYLPFLLVIVIARNPYSQDSERGRVRDITYSRISVNGRRTPPSSFSGLDAEHTVQDVSIQALRVNGKLAMTAQEANLTIGPGASDVRFSPAP